MRLISLTGITPDFYNEICQKPTYGPGDNLAAITRQSLNSGRLNMPVLFLHGANDFILDTIGSRLAENLTEVFVQSGHWMAQECPVAVNAALAKCLLTSVAA